MSLIWDASYEIVLTLMAEHPDVEPDDVSLQQLYDWIIALPDFADDPLLVNDQILSAILREWYEERHAQ